ncbi:MAG: hypothetical protein HY892_11075 [Deltaproteobacteria bacterium]|nr:hypothetical protein [Deltaproteobacteria bacterium]
MSPFFKFIIRALLSAGLAIIISRFFFHRFTVGTILIALFLLGMAYISEYARARHQ